MLHVEEDTIGLGPAYVAFYWREGERVVEQWSRSPLEAATRALETAALRITVKPGQCQPMFAEGGGRAYEYDLRDEAGNNCDSLGKPLAVGKVRWKK